jgi:hypothetical protein
LFDDGRRTAGRDSVISGYPAGGPYYGTAIPVTKNKATALFTKNRGCCFIFLSTDKEIVMIYGEYLDRFGANYNRTSCAYFIMLAKRGLKVDYVISFVKSILMFAVGLFAFRVMGSQSVGRLTDFDLVVVIAIGALIGAALADPELNPLLIITAIAGLVMLQVAVSLLAMKSPFIEKMVMGSPIKLIENGKVVRSGLRRARITRRSLDQELRVKGLTALEKIKEAYMEPNGKLSIIEKSSK